MKHKDCSIKCNKLTPRQKAMLVRLKFFDASIMRGKHTQNRLHK